MVICDDITFGVYKKVLFS